MDTVKFVKMQGCGNDYVYIDCFQNDISKFDIQDLAVKISDRHFGVGGDGLVLIAPSDIADAKMRMFNADGSEGNMCGNAIRCVGKYVFENGYVNKETIEVETKSGIKTLSLNVKDNEVKSVKVKMGKAEFACEKIPVLYGTEKEVINKPLVVNGKEYNITCVSVGNPHCVVFCGKVDAVDVAKIGPEFENSEIFPERVNTEFVRVINKNTLKMRVFERGNGETWACGTGACAAAVAAVENGYCEKGEDITVKLKGGDLTVNYTDETVLLTGDAKLIYEGVFEY